MNPKDREKLIKALKESAKKKRTPEEARDNLIKLGLLNPDGSLSPNYYTKKQIKAWEKKMKKKQKVCKKNWKDISVEKWRQYNYVRSGDIYGLKIENPDKLLVRDSGSHMVMDKDGLIHLMPSDYINICFDGEVIF